MPTMFEKEDIAECFGTDCTRAPAYRFLTLTADGIVEGEQMGGVHVSVLCEECLVGEHSLGDLGGPIVYGEKRTAGPPDIAFLVLPLHLTRHQVAQLREEITEEVPVTKAI